jgi:hypothetical protein
MSFEHIDNQFIDTLESSGIIDAYEYVIRKLIEEGYWIDDEYYEAIEDVDNSSQYSIWDAIDDEIEAAGNIDWEG